LRPRFADIAQHLARLVACAVALALAARGGPLALLVAASAALFFAAFALMHDVSHGALRLPRKANEVALAAAGALLLMSGHALRLMHLRHHARPLADDDIEGAPARLPLFWAIASAPYAALTLRVAAFRAARRQGKLLQLAETAVNAAAIPLAIASGSRALVAYVAVALALQLTMALWAAYIPHNAPRWLVRAAERLAFTGFTTALSLAYHALHHRRPDVPCGRLRGGV
jgi:fatty acid desaturase